MLSGNELIDYQVCRNLEFQLSMDPVVLGPVIFLLTFSGGSLIFSSAVWKYYQNVILSL